MKKIILFLLLLLLLGGAFVAWKIFGPSVKQPEGKYFYIHTGETFQGMLDSLDEKKIADPQWVSRTAKYLKFRLVKPGRYEIKKGMSVFELVRMLRAGSQSPVNFVVTKFRTKEALAARSVIPTDFTWLKKNFTTSNRGMPLNPGSEFALLLLTMKVAGRVDAILSFNLVRNDMLNDCSALAGILLHISNDQCNS